MKIIGVTGGIGSGKTTVCRILEELGARVFSADQEAKRLMQEDPTIRDEIVEAFGPESYDVQGQLNRKYLAQTVFSSPKHVLRINEIVHPHVFNAFEEATENALADDVPLLVHESALLFEIGAADHFDATVVVHATEKQRIQRVVARDQVTPEAVRARMAYQLPPEELRQQANYIIENVGSVEDLREEVEAVYQAVLGIVNE